MSFSCECSCSSPRRVSNFNSNVPQGGIYPHINFERDSLNIFRVRALTSYGSMGGRGGEAKTIISQNTLFGDIIMYIILATWGTMGGPSIIRVGSTCLPVILSLT